MGIEDAKLAIFRCEEHGNWNYFPQESNPAEDISTDDDGWWWAKCPKCGRDSFSVLVSGDPDESQ